MSRLSRLLRRQLRSRLIGEVETMTGYSIARNYRFKEAEEDRGKEQE
jgi:hypothetical protein